MRMQNAEAKINIARMYGLDETTLLIWDRENDPNTLFFNLPETETPQVAEDEKSESEAITQQLRETDQELQEKIDRLQQLIELLLQLIAMKQTQI